MVSSRLTAELLDTDPVSGKSRGLVATVRRVARAMNRSKLGYSIIGATALSVRGLPRMTVDIDLVVMLDEAEQAIRALSDARLQATTPVGSASAPESMIVFVDPLTQVEVDLLNAAGEPEATAIEHATETRVFGVTAKVATLESLLLLYLYSNEPKHLGDFASIVRSGKADLTMAERTLAELHPPMLATWQRRVDEARSPAPAPPRPPKRR